MPPLEMWSDLSCPYAYLAAYRLRRVLPEFPDVRVEHKCLGIEWVDSKPTPWEILHAETPILMLSEPDAPYEPWRRSPSHWPSTILPAFEAVKCAELQGWREAHELDWRIREAFFAENECIALRHVLLRLARDAGLDADRFADDWDSGSQKRRVIAESREGWKVRGYEASPTFALPDGSRHTNPAQGKVVLDAHTSKLLAIRPPKDPAPPLEWYRAVLRRVAQPSARTRASP